MERSERWSCWRSRQGERLPVFFLKPALSSATGSDKSKFARDRCRTSGLREQALLHELMLGVAVAPLTHVLPHLRCDVTEDLLRQRPHPIHPCFSAHAHERS